MREEFYILKIQVPNVNVGSQLLTLNNVIAYYNFTIVMACRRPTLVETCCIT